MKRLFQISVKTIALVLICALSAPIGYAAPKKHNPEAIHSKIAKRGIGNWVCIEEANGIVLLGRITTIDEQAFGMQLENYPEITMVNYADVIRVRNLGFTNKGMAIWIGVSVGTFIAAALIMHHEFEKNKPTLPTNPGTPTFP